jgi:hypothetical protein
MDKSIEVSPVEIARYMDQETYDQVIEFHAKSNYSLLPGTAHRCYLSIASDKALSEMIESELSLWPGFKPSVQLTSGPMERDEILREQSGHLFDDSKSLDFSLIDKFLVNSFGIRNDGSRKRPYPSGGALYPI